MCSGSVLFRLSGILHGSSASCVASVFSVSKIFLSANTVMCMLDLLHALNIIGIFDA